MTSNINPNNIDGTFPVAGVDNDSQGFRTNFTNIKNNFTYSKTEIGDLQDKVLLKSALSGGTLDNSMAGALISGAEIRDFRETRYDIGTASGAISLNHALGHYQQVITSGSITIAFTGIPALGKVARIRFEITVSNVGHTLTLPAAVSLGTTGISGLNTSTNILTFSAVGTYIFEFTTDDAGSTYHIQDLTRPRDYFYSDHIRLVPRTITDSRGASGDIAGMVAVDTSTPAIWLCTGTYDGTTIIWRHAELETVANEYNLASNVTTTSSSLSTITGLSFVASPGVSYRFEAFIPFTHSAAATNTHTFSVNFTGTGAVCYATIEQQAGPTTAPSIATISTSDATTSVATTSSTSIKMCRITGTFTAPAAPTSQRTLAIRFATNGGTLTALAGSYLRFNRV